MRYNLQEIAAASFAELARKYNLRCSAAEERSYGEFVVYQNQTTAVRVYIEYHDQDIFLQLFRVKDGQIPRFWGVQERTADPMNGFDLNDLLSLRAPEEGIVDQIKGQLTSQAVEDVLKTYARVLEAYADDILRGDFSVFPDLAQVVESRRQNYLRSLQ